jgi:serine/threonine protein kinase
MEGGELFDHIVQHGSFGEKDASSFMKQVLSGIGYLHEVIKLKLFLLIFKDWSCSQRSQTGKSTLYS